MADTTDTPEASEGFFQRARLMLPRKRRRWVMPEQAEQRTEVEVARYHLVNCQHHLRQRRHGRGVEMMIKEMRVVAMNAFIAEAEKEVLAALSLGVGRAGARRAQPRTTRMDPGLGRSEEGR